MSAAHSPEGEGFSPRGIIARWFYDTKDRLVRFTDPASNDETYAYDALDNLISKRNRNGDTIHFNYDLCTQRFISSKRYNEDVAAVADFDYDLAGNLMRARGGNLLSFAYNEFDEKTEDTYSFNQNGEDGPSGKTDYDYDSSGNRVILRNTALSVNVGYRYDSLDRPTSIGQFVDNAVDPPVRAGRDSPAGPEGLRD